MRLLQSLQAAKIFQAHLSMSDELALSVPQGLAARCTAEYLAEVSQTTDVCISLTGL